MAQKFRARRQVYVPPLAFTKIGPYDNGALHDHSNIDHIDYTPVTDREMLCFSPIIRTPGTKAGQVPALSAGQNAAFQLNLAKNNTGGSFTLTVTTPLGTGTTAPITFDSDVDDIEAALQRLTVVGFGNVCVWRDTTVTATRHYEIEFYNNLVGATVTCVFGVNATSPTLAVLAGLTTGADCLITSTKLLGFTCVDAESPNRNLPRVFSIPPVEYDDDDTLAGNSINSGPNMGTTGRVIQYYSLIPGAKFYASIKPGTFVAESMINKNCDLGYDKANGLYYIDAAKVAAATNPLVRVTGLNVISALLQYNNIVEFSVIGTASELGGL
jgi:hypothetical protein